MWARNYTNQWSNKRLAAIVTALFSVLITGVIYYLTGQVAFVTLRRLFTLTIMSLPVSACLVWYLASSEARGYAKGAQEKLQRQQVPVYFPPPDQSGVSFGLPEPSIEHRETRNALTS